MYIWFVVKTTKQSNIMETAQIAQVKPRQIEIIEIELDEYYNFSVKEMEIGYGDDFLVFDLDVYQTVEHFSGTEFAPGGTELKSTSITIDNLIWYNADGDVILMTDDQKLSLEKEITNKIKTV
jgi:hypothetical protein